MPVPLSYNFCAEISGRYVCAALTLHLEYQAGLTREPIPVGTIRLATLAHGVGTASGPPVSSFALKKIDYSLEITQSHAGTRAAALALQPQKKAEENITPWTDPAPQDPVAR